MADYIQTTAEDWLKQNELSDAIISHPNAGEQYQQTVSDALKAFGRLIIEQTVENCNAHSDSEIDKEGAIINTYKQFGL